MSQRGDRQEHFARASIRPRCAERAPLRALDDAGRSWASGGVSRSACSASSAAAIGAPRVLARAAACSRDSGDFAIRALRRKREVTGAVERIAGDDVARRPCARRRSSAGSAVVEHRREQRVREANRPVNVCSITCAARAGSSTRSVTSRIAKKLRRRDGRAPMRVAARLRSPAEARRGARERDPRVSRGHERLRGVDVRTQSPRELERVERVPTGRLVHA